MTVDELLASVRAYRRHGVTRDEQLVIRAQWSQMGIRNWFHALRSAQKRRELEGQGG